MKPGQNKVGQTTSYHDIAKGLNRSPTRVNAYCTFLETCLDIDKHFPLSLTPSGTLGFFYKLLNHNPTMGGTMNMVVHTLTTLMHDPEEMDTTVTTQSFDKLNASDEPVVDEITFTSCSSNNVNVGQMMQTFWPSI
jgi:hypothetical protein